MSAPPTTPSGNTSSVIRLFIECHNLIDKDTFSKSDPFCNIRIKNATQPAFQDIGRTEVRMMSKTNPKSQTPNPKPNPTKRTQLPSPSLGSNEQLEP